MTELTVCMPVYNGEKYLKQCIESVLNQTLRDFKFLIYDDGSTDDTVGIIESYHDGRIEIIRGEKNEGAIHARASLIERIDTEYNMWIDADDFFCDANALRFALETIKSEDFDLVNFVVHKLFYKDGMSSLYKDSRGKETYKFFGENPFKECFPVENCYTFWSKIFKTELLRRCIPEEEIVSKKFVGDDVFFIFMCFFLAKRYLHFVDVGMAFYGHRVGIGYYGSIDKEIPTDEQYRGLCEYAYYCMVSLHNRISRMRPTDEIEDMRLVNIRLGLVNGILMRLRKSSDMETYNRFLSIWNEYFCADGVHVLNGYDAFAMPEKVDEIKDMICNA